MPDAGVLATILLVVGLFLVAMELMIPSFGVIGTAAAICMLISLWSAWQAWWGVRPGFFAAFMLVWVGGLPSVFVGTLYLIQHTSLGRFVVLRTRANEDDGPNLEIQERLHDLVGAQGKTVSPLVPGGMVAIDGERHHAECVGPMLESGVTVQVVDVKLTRLVVRKTSESAAKRAQSDAVLPELDSEQQTLPKPVDGGSGDQLDFDIPDNYTAD